MKKEEIVNIDDILDDYESNLSDELRVRLDKYIKELRDMNNDQLPHYGEELMSSIFAMQQQLAERQTKLARYIKSQQNIIRLNFFINQNKVIEAYVLIIFELKKIKAILEKYKSEFKIDDEEYKLRLSTLRSYMKDYENFINGHDETDKNILVRMNQITKQYDLMSSLFNVRYSHIEDIGKTIEEYSGLSNTYTLCGQVYCSYPENASEYFKKITSINYILKNKETKYCEFTYSCRFNEIKSTLILNKYFHDIIKSKQITDLLFDENKLKKLSFCIGLRHQSFIGDAIEEIESELATTLIDVDTIGSLKDSKDYTSINDSEFLNNEYTDSVMYMGSMYRPANDNEVEKLMKIVYAESILNLLEKQDIFIVFNNSETCEVIKILVQIIYKRNYSIDFNTLRQITINYLKKLESDKNSHKIKFEIRKFLNGIHDSKIFNQQLDKEESDTMLKSKIIEFAFEKNIKKRNTNYLTEIYFSDFMNLNGVINKLNFNFNLTKEIITELFYLFYIGNIFEEYCRNNEIGFHKPQIDEMMNYLRLHFNIKQYKEIGSSYIYRSYIEDYRLVLHPCDFDEIRIFISATSNTLNKPIFDYVKDTNCYRICIRTFSSSDVEFSLEDWHELIIEKFNEIVKCPTKSGEKILSK